MNDVARLFQAFISPAIFFSATALLILSINVRLMGIVSRLRQYVHAKHDVAKNGRGAEADAYNAQIASIQQRAEIIPALTQLAQAGCDSFTLARIAGHSSITITQRYIHPQADAIERAFAPLASASVISSEAQKSGQVGTDLGTVSEGAKSDALQVLGAKGGTRTPTVLPARS